MYWMSVLEVTLFSVGLLLFFTYPSQMAYIFLHIIHIGRGILGFIINRSLPKSHDLVQDITNSLKQAGDDEDAPLTFETFRTRATNQMRSVFISLVTALEDRLKLYMALTVATCLLDFIDFIIQLVRFGGRGDVSLPRLLNPLCYSNTRTSSC